MIRFRTLLVSAAFAFAVVAAAPRAAHADTTDSKTGFPCNLTVSWQTTSVNSSIFSGPGCSGSYIGNVSIAQSGGYPTSCPAYTQASATAMQTMAQNLLQQLRAGKGIQLWEVVVTNGPTCTTAINFLP